MKMNLRFSGLLFLFSLFGLSALQSQTQINPKIGFESWSLKDEMADSGNSSHSGQTIGFDVYITHNRLLFAPGFYYHRMSILNQEEGFNFKFQKRNGTHYFSIPLTFGLQVIDLPGIDAYVMGGGESTFFYSLDSNDLSLDDDKLHGVFAGLTGGAQVELFSFVTLDVKYHHALHPIIKERPESKLRGWTFAAGIKF
jgi:hypothetical protein